MSVIGIDFGSDACVIGQAGGMGAAGAAPGRGGIEIVLNDNSKRRTPSLVSFQEAERFIGEHAEPLLRSNAKNTPYMMKSLLGRNFHDTEVQELMKKLPFTLVPMEGDHIGIEVSYDGSKRVLSPEQITAILLNHCANMAQKGTKNTGKAEVVISVPPFWNDAQRRAMYHASQIAGVKCLRLINENVACALDYGIYKNLRGEFTDKPQHMLFVDMGYSSTHATVVAYTIGKMQVLSCSYDRHLGSRSCDEAIADYIANGFIAKYKSDPRENARSMAKLMVAAEKVKKTLSPEGVDKAPIYIECLHDDRDYQSELTKNDFQSMCLEKKLPERLQAVALKALSDAGLSVSDSFICEIIGGGMRVPQMKRSLAQVLNTKIDEQNYGLSTTLNMDETVARGCSMQCAMLSPRLRVKSYEVIDCVPFGIICRSIVNGKEQVLDLYKRNDAYPSYRRITYPSKEDIKITLEYSDEALSMMMNGTRRVIAETTVKAIEKMKVADDPVVFVNFCIDAHGLCYLYNSSVKIRLPEEIPKEEEEKKMEEEEKKVEEEEKKVEGEEKKVETPKKEEEKKIEVKFSTDSLSSSSIFTGLTVDQIKEAESIEKRMISKDDEIRSRNESKNSLESYVYNMRDRVNNIYKIYIKDDIKETFLSQLEAAETWLYDDEGYFADREMYIKRLSDLQAIGEPVVYRFNENQNRSDSVNKLSHRLETLTRQLNTPQEKYDHITDEEKKPIRDLIVESRVWLDKMLVAQAELAMTVDPVLKCGDCMDRVANVDSLFTKVMSKLKPKEETPKGTPKEETPKGTPKESESPKEEKEEKKMEEEEKEEPSEEKMEEE